MADRRRRPCPYQGHPNCCGLGVPSDPTRRAVATSLDLGAVQVWYACPETVTSPRLLEAYRAMLSADETRRLGRFHFALDRLHYLVAHVLLRTALSLYASVEPRAWAFATKRYGRPVIAGPRCAPPLLFSLSHTRGLVACAVAAGREVGLDVETLSRRVDGEVLAERFFARQEAAALRSLPPTLRRVRFFEYWTLKESYLKARGWGLSRPLASFAFDLRADGDVALDASGLRDDASTWQFALHRPTSEHVLAVAVRRGRQANCRVLLSELVPCPPLR